MPGRKNKAVAHKTLEQKDKRTACKRRDKRIQRTENNKIRLLLKEGFFIMYPIEVEYKMHQLLQGQPSATVKAILKRALNELEDKPNRLSIRTIPYKDRYKLCSNICTIYSGLTDDDMKCQILRVAGRELDFAQTRILMNLLDTINIDNIRQKHITVQIKETAVALEEF